MAVIETWFDQDLMNAVSVRSLRGNLFTADNGGNLIGVRVTKNGEDVELSGSCYGYVIRADGDTVVINGTISDNTAKITLPTSCYVVPGEISIVIKVGTTTVAACTGYVYRSITDTIVDPGTVVPSLAELLAQISDCEDATTAATAAAAAANQAAEDFAAIIDDTAGSGATGKVWSADKLADEFGDIQDDVTDLLNAKAPSVFETSSGSIASFPDGADGMALKSLSVSVDPVQDLHGYGYPWPDGGGANQFGDYTVVNAYIDSSGNLISESNNRAYIIPIKASTGYAYKIVRTPASGVTDNDDVQIGEYYGDTRPTTGATGVRLVAGSYDNNVKTGTLTTSANAKWLVVKVGNVTKTNVEATASTVQIEVGSSVSATYTPYSNICPITGHSSATVTRTGKNILCYTPNKLSTPLSVTLDTTRATYVKANVDYTFSFGMTNATNWRIGAILFDENGNRLFEEGAYLLGQASNLTSNLSGKYYVWGSNATVTSIKITPVYDCWVMLFWLLGDTSDSTQMTNAQIESGSSASSYEPYTAQSVTIPLGQTVYGGTLDAVARTLTVDRAMIQISSDWNWSVSPLNNPEGTVFVTSGYEFAQYDSQGLKSNAFYESPNGALATSPANTCWWSSSGTPRFIYGKPNGGTTATEWTTFLTNTPVYVCAKQKTPTVITGLDQATIATLLGVNNIWSDTGNVSVDYPADTKLYIDRKITEAIANALNA